jgi:hypothetical protein
MTATTTEELNVRYRYKLVATLSAAVTTIGLVAGASPASAASATSCDGSLSSQTIAGPLTVPANGNCELTNVVVNGKATVSAGADLTLTDSTVNSAVAVRSGGFLNASGASVTGALSLDSAFGAFLDHTSVGGSITASGTAFLYLIGAEVRSVSSTNGATYLDSTSVAKDVSTMGDTYTDLFNSTVGGGLTVANSLIGSVVCASEVSGDVTFSGASNQAGSLLQLGATQPQPGCAYDVFGGNVTLSGNSTLSSIGNDIIRGDLSCTGNSVAPAGSSTRIRGQATGQCAAVATHVTGLPTAREAATLQASDARRTAAVAAAAVAGPAPLVSGPTPCVGTVSGLTVSGDLSVPANSSCQLTNTTVTGKVTVGTGANLVASGSTLGGALTVQSGAYVSATSSSIAGAVTDGGGFGIYLQGTTLAGNVTATNGGFFYSIGSTTKAVTSTGGETYFESSWVTRNLSTNGDSLTDFNDSVVQGTAFISNPTKGTVACNSEFDQAVTISGARSGTGSLVQLGATGPTAGCTLDVFGSALTLTNNSAPSYAGDPVVAGDLACTANSPAPTHTDTRVRGTATGQCA